MRLKKILLFFFAAVVFICGALWILGSYFESEVKALVINRINQRLTAPVSVQEIDLTLFDNFPQAAIRFTRVSVADKLSPGKKDTLLYADKLYLTFNIWDILDKKYRITELNVEGGIFNLKFDGSGRSNLNFWSEDSAKSNADFSLELTSVKISNLLFNFVQEANGQVLNSFIRKGTFSGNLSSDRYTLDANVSSRVYLYKIRGVEYITNKDVDSKAGLEIDNIKGVVNFRDAALSVNALDFLVNGSVDYSDTPGIDLRITGEQIRIDRALTNLPDFVKEHLSDYDAKGSLTVSARLYGPLDNNKLPLLESDFSVSQAELFEKSNKVRLSALNLEGKYHTGFSGTDDSLWVSRASGQFPSGSFNLAGQVFNFMQPQFQSKLKGKLDLEHFYKFFRWEGTELVKGKVDFDLKSHGSLSHNKDFSKEDLSKIDASGYFRLSSGQLKLRGAVNEFREVGFNLELAGNQARLSNFGCLINNSDFRGNAEISNLVPYILDKQAVLAAKGNLSSARLNVSDFIHTTGSSQAEITFLPNVECRFNITVDDLAYRQFRAGKVAMDVLLSGSGLQVKNIGLLSCGGKITGDLVLGRSGTGYFFESKARLAGVDLQKTFSQLENFGQDFITDKEVKGRTDAALSVEGKLDSRLQLEASSLQVSAEIKVSDGELNDLKSLAALGNYIRSSSPIRAFVNGDKLSARLQHVKFSTLENTITIRNSQVVIPEMLIQSSALDLYVNGVHHFDGRINYGFNFRMAEVFKKNEVTENGYIVDDNTGLRMFITMAGTTAAPAFEYDKTAASMARKEKFKQEKALAKTLLKQELGLTKRDSTTMTGKKPPPRFELEPPAQAGKTTVPVSPAKKPAAKTKEKTEYDTKEYNLDDDL